MADSFILELLLKLLADPLGREAWLKRKQKIRWLDLASADFTEKNLRGYDLSEANLSTAVFLAADMREAVLRGALLNFADLRRANLREAILEQANLSSANLEGACLIDARLEEANLGGARLNEADLIGADLTGADLNGADLSGAIIKYARLVGANLEGANVDHADLTGCVMDDDAPLAMVNFDLATIDDRKYRVMKSRLLASRSRELDLAESDESTEEDEHDAEEKKSLIQLFKKFTTEDGGGVTPAINPIDTSYIANEDDLRNEEGWHLILGIPHGTPMAGVTKAFRMKAKRFHPDMVRFLSEEDQEIATEQFRLAREAYEKLMRKLTKPLVKVLWPEEVPLRESAYDYSLDEYIILARSNPDHTDVLYNLAWKYFDGGRLDEAIDTYELVVNLDPDDEDAEFNLRIVKLCKSFDIMPDMAFDVT